MPGEFHPSGLQGIVLYEQVEPGVFKPTRLLNGTAEGAAKISEIDPAHAQSYRQKVTARTATDLMISADVSHIHHGIFTLSGLTAENVTLTATRDDVSGLPVPVIASDGTHSDGSALGNGTYRLLDLAADILRWTKSAGSEAATLTFQGYP